MGNIYAVIMVDNDYGGDPELTWHLELAKAVKEAQENHEGLVDSGGSACIHWFDPETGKAGFVADWLGENPVHKERME